MMAAAYRRAAVTLSFVTIFQLLRYMWPWFFCNCLRLFEVCSENHSVGICREEHMNCGDWPNDRVVSHQELGDWLCMLSPRRELQGHGRPWQTCRKGLGFQFLDYLLHLRIKISACQVSDKNQIMTSKDFNKGSYMMLVLLLSAHD